MDPRVGEARSREPDDDQRGRDQPSTDNGASWSNPVSFGSFAKAASGVGLAATSNNEVMLGFAWSGYQTYGINTVRTFRCHVSGGQLQFLWTMWPGQQTRIQPALTYERTRAVRIGVARSELRYFARYHDRRSSRSGVEWSGVEQSSSAPLLQQQCRTRSRQPAEYGESVLWCAYEGP